MMKRIARRNSSHRRRRGSTLLEFAMVIPVLLAILLGIIEFGWYVKNQLTIANATREGARVAAIGSTAQQIRQRVINAGRPVIKADTSGNVTNGSITLGLSPRADNGATFSTTFPADDNTKSPPVNGAQRGDFIRVTSDIAHQPLTGFPFLSNRRINIAVTMVRE